MIYEEDYKSLFPKQNLKVIYRFDLAHVGWECDSDGMIIEDESGTRHLILTNHGCAYIGTQEELTAQINQYKKLIENTVYAQQLLGILI